MILKTSTSSTMMSYLIEAGLWIDDMIYSLISSVYSLINQIAQIQIFDSGQISSFSNKIYALLGVFMLFKLSFSMITYLVNPDEFSDKSKGFGSLIKNVIITMVLIVAVPYIFAEAYYVQKMILEDGTIIKLIYNEEDGAPKYSHVVDTAGEDIKFILFSQFVRPNSNIPQCKTLYVYDENDNVLDDNGKKTMNEACKDALRDAFCQYNDCGSDNENPPDVFTYYVDGMEYESYELLTSEPGIYTEKFKATDSKGKSADKNIITYHWVISTIVGIVTLLILVTICLDIAVRTIKLSFYQLIAPIPIVSYIDPKGKKDGMFQKWAKACIETYLDLFIRLFGLFLGIYIVLLVVNSYKFNGLISVILIIGALMFAKQLPKIIQDLTGLKLDGKFTLNPFKKIKNEIPEGLSKGLHQARLRTTGAAGGFVAGMIGGGRNFGQRAFSSALGSVRGAVKGKGFMAGVNAQADVNRKIRDARINGATFMGGVGAAAASTFGLDYANLEKQSTNFRENQDRIDAKRREVDAKNKVLDTQKKGIERKIAPRQNIVAKQKGVIDNMKALQNDATSLIKGDKAGEHFKKWHHFYQGQDKYVAALNELSSLDGVKLNQVIRSADGKHIYRPGEQVTKQMLEAVGFDNTGYYENKIGRDELLEDLRGPRMADGKTAKGVAADKASHHDQLYKNLEQAIQNYADSKDNYKNEIMEEIKYETLSDEEKAQFDEKFEEDFIDVNINKRISAGKSFADAISGQISDSEDNNIAINRSMDADNIMIENIEREKKSNVTDARVAYKNYKTGKQEELSLEEAENIQSKEKNEIDSKTKAYDENKKSADANRSGIFPNG